MKAHKHIVVGVVASILPDLVMATYPWKGELEPDDHLARLHRFMHSPSGLLVVFCVCYGLHVLIDWLTHPPYLYRKGVDNEYYHQRQEEWRSANE